jgi:hypothetical protein
MAKYGSYALEVQASNVIEILLGTFLKKSDKQVWSKEDHWKHTVNSSLSHSIATFDFSMTFFQSLVQWGISDSFVAGH